MNYCPTCKAKVMPEASVCKYCDGSLEVEKVSSSAGVSSQPISTGQALVVVVAQVTVYFVIALVASFVVPPVYCNLILAEACPYKIPGLKLAFVASAPFAILVADFAFIFIVAPNVVPIGFAKLFMERQRPKFLRPMYARLFALSYARKSA